jgi:multicomponent Na+:H+ antiporter subunit B
LSWLTVTVLALFFALLVYAERDLPNPGDASAPARTHVVPRYVEQSYSETRTPNIVTSVLADYRGYDTLGETVVILTAGIAVILILPRNGRRG